MDKPQLYLLVGYPGAGKTTVAQIIAETTGAVHLWADQERLKMFGQPSHSPAENIELYAHLNKLTEQLLGEGKSVIFDTNFNFHKDRLKLRDIAAQQGAETLVVWVTTPKPMAKRRATEDSDGQATRLYGNMSTQDFDRLANHLEPPTQDEKVMRIDGVKLDRAALVQLLRQ